MDVSAFVNTLLPELILAVGACAALIIGVDKSTRPIAGPFALVVTLAALVAAIYVAPDAEHRHFPGLLITPLVHYVRLAGLITGAVILLCNMHLPVAEERGEFFSLVLFSFTGLLLTAAANDLMVLFFAIELVSIPTYVLISLSRTDARASESAVKYFFLGAMAAALMLYGFSFLYGSLGGTLTLMANGTNNSMAEFVIKTTAASSSGLSIYAFVGLILALAGVFFKLAAAPFHFYAADVYEGAASPVTGLLGFLPKFAGLVAAIKLLTIFNWFSGDSSAGANAVQWLLWIVAALTMTIGNTLALLQSNVKRMLAYSSVAHSGYMLVALLVGPVAGQGPMHDGVTAALFYMVVYGLMNLGAFAVLAALNNKDEAVEQIEDLEGLSTKRPALAAALAVCCFSLMGFPPTAGLLGKVYIFSSAFSVGSEHPFGTPLIALAIIGVINSAIGAAYYLRIIGVCYLRPSRTQLSRSGGVALSTAIAVCSLAMIFMFIRPTAVANSAAEASNDLTTATQNIEIAAVTTTAANGIQQ